MIIAQISDTHLTLDTPDADQRRRDFALTIADLNALDPRPDVIVHTGDVAHNGRKDEYSEAAAILGKARAKFSNKPPPVRAADSPKRGVPYIPYAQVLWKI